MLGLVGTQAFKAKLEARVRSGTEGVDEAQSLKGKVFIVTGGNSGIGKGVAIRLAAKGAEVYIICRRNEAAEEAVDEIKRKALSAGVENPCVEYRILDMSNIREVHKFGQEWVASDKPLDGLCNNAGNVPCP